MGPQRPVLFDKTDKKVILPGLIAFGLAVVVAVIGSKASNPAVWLVSAVLMMVFAIYLARLVLRVMRRIFAASKYGKQK